jgi:ribonuclease BN (tRNA processing enzyme)
VTVDLTILGSAGWMPSAARDTACYAVREDDRVLVLDAGTGIHRLVTDPTVLAGATAVDVLVSHFHLDHVIGLSYLSGLNRDVTVTIHGPGRWLYGRSSTEILDDLIGPPFHSKTLSDNGIAVAELDSGGLRWGSHRLLVRHQQLHTAPSVAFRLDDLFCYCTDTEYDPRNAAFAAGSTVLLHEAWLLVGITEDGHSSAGQAATIARDAGVEQLILVHLPPWLDAESSLAEARQIFPMTSLATDGMTIGLDSG